MNTENRRQLKTRGKAWVKTLTNWLVKTRITPNQISLLSLIFAGLSGVAFASFSNAQNTLFLFLGAGFIQLRLLCNLMDGLVAVEGGKGTASGELFNDIPDRFADIFILVGVGYAITEIDYGVTLGWIAAMLAVVTAYIRVLGSSLSAPISFMGPMAKQHRMATLTAASMLVMLETWFFDSHWLLVMGVWIIIVGSTLTACRRSLMIYRFLEQNNE